MTAAGARALVIAQVEATTVEEFGTSSSLENFEALDIDAESSMMPLRTFIVQPVSMPRPWALLRPCPFEGYDLSLTVYYAHADGSVDRALLDASAITDTLNGLGQADADMRTVDIIASTFEPQGQAVFASRWDFSISYAEG